MKDHHDDDDDDENDGSPGLAARSSSLSSSSLIPEGILPSYLATAFGELYEEDGLMVMAKGLGWMNLLASFVRFYADVEQGHVAALMMEEKDANNNKNNNDHHNSKKPPLVLVLGLKDAEHDALLSILDSWGTPHAMMPKSINNRQKPIK